MSNKTRPSEPLTLSQFLVGAGMFEGGMLLVAFALGFLMKVHPTAELQWSWKSFGIGILATVPMLLLLVASFLSKSNGLNQIRIFLRDLLGPMLDRCRLIDIIFLSLMAGICEEVLFRGFLFQWARGINATFAIMFVNVLFGLAHAITPLYAWLAGLTGLYLTAIMSLESKPNLLIPITAHSAYDLVAFLVDLWDYRRNRANRMANTEDETDVRETAASEEEPLKCSMRSIPPTERKVPPTALSDQRDCHPSYWRLLQPASEKSCWLFRSRSASDNFLTHQWQPEKRPPI